MSAVTIEKVPVSTRALMQRINRKLAHDGERLKTNRSERWYTDLGWYYIVNDYNAIVAGHCDLEELGRELGVLKSWESLAE